MDPTAPCLNCGDPTRGEYCPTCGQRKADVQVSIRAMVAEALEDELTVDRRLPNTLFALFFQPGRLTVEYVNGRIVRYIRPFRLYLVTSVIFFLLLSFTSLRFIRAAMVTGPADAAVAGDTLSIAELDAQIDGVRTALDEPGLPGVARTTLQATHDHLLRQRQALEERRAGQNDTVPVTPDAAPDVQPEIDSPPAQPPPPRASGQGTPWLENVNVNLGHPVLDSAAAARLRTLGNLEPREAVQQVVSDFIRVIPTVMFIVLPLFAVILKLLYIRRRRFYAEHFIFLLHTHAFIYLLFTMMLGLVALGWALPWLLMALFAWMIIYIYLAMRRVYGQGRLKTFVKWWVLGWMYFWILAFTGPLAIVAMLVLG